MRVKVVTPEGVETVREISNEAEAREVLAEQVRAVDQPCAARRAPRRRGCAAMRSFPAAALPSSARCSACGYAQLRC